MKKPIRRRRKDKLERNKGWKTQVPSNKRNNPTKCPRNLRRMKSPIIPCSRISSARLTKSRNHPKSKNRRNNKAKSRLWMKCLASPPEKRKLKSPARRRGRVRRIKT